MLSGLDVGTTTASNDRKTFPDSRDLVKGCVRRLGGVERVGTFQPFLMLRIIGLSRFTGVEGKATLAARPLFRFDRGVATARKDKQF